MPSLTQLDLALITALRTLPSAEMQQLLDQLRRFAVGDEISPGRIEALRAYVTAVAIPDRDRT